MSTEYKLSYTANEIDEKLGMIDQLSEEMKQQGTAYSDYMQDEINAVTERLQAIQYAAPNSTTFAFCTDLHYREYRDPVRLQNIMGSVAAISKVCPVELIAFGGDNLADSKGDGQEALALAKHFGDILYKNQTVIAAPVLGNHDDNTLKSRSVTGSCLDSYKLKNGDYYTRAWRQIENIPGVCIGSREGLYYYVDLEAQKTRLIFLNCVDVPYIVGDDGVLKYAVCKDNGYSNEQLNWVANVALDFSDKAMPDEWIVATVQHYTDNPDIDDFSGGNSVVKEERNGQVMLNILHAFNARTAYTFERTEGDFACSVDCDYANAKGKIICRFSGHTHKDAVAVSNGILYISTVGACSNDEVPDVNGVYENVPNTGDESGWDIFTIDMDHEVVHATRFGTGVSRTITFDGEVTYPESDEPVEPEEPDVPDEPAAPTLPYHLAEPTVFDGTSKYIDTDIKLVERDIDFTIAVRVTPTTQVNTAGSIFFNTTKLHMGFNANSAQYCVFAGNPDGEIGYLNVQKTTTEPFAVVITHASESEKMNVKVLKPDGTFKTVQDYGMTLQTSEDTLLLGAYRASGGYPTNFWAGTMHDFQIHDRVWTDDEIAAYLV